MKKCILLTNMDTPTRLTDLENTVKMVTSLLESTRAELGVTRSDLGMAGAELARVVSRLDTLERDYAARNSCWAGLTSYTKK